MSGAVLRDEGTSRVLARAGGTWKDLAEFFVWRYLSRQDGLFEEARAYAETCFDATPPNKNAWGALALSMSTGGLIEKTGEHRCSHAFVSNHARSAAVWRARPIPTDHENPCF